VAQFHKPSMGAGARQITAAQQGGLSLLDCARLGVFIHGRVADRWAAGRTRAAGMLAQDLLDGIPDAMSDL
jgi:NAD(P)H-hydrate repair Nnr-like enzyme with NAD(P)H-hydrate dehydratase domain